MQSMEMFSSFSVEVKVLVASGGTVMTERVDTFESKANSSVWKSGR